MKQNKFSRFNYYETAHERKIFDPKRTGLVPHNKDYEFGTPNCERHETVSLIASNSTLRERLQVAFKWRPHTDDKRLVTLASELKLTLVNDTTGAEHLYEFNRIETYCLPDTASNHEPLLQYGSEASPLKLIVASPYRRMRLVFCGRIKRSTAGVKDEELGDVFLKFSAMINSTTEVFDMMSQILDDKSHLWQQTTTCGRELKRSLLNQFDIHEHKVRINGVYFLHHNNQLVKTKLSLWGFHRRQFHQHTHSPPSPPIQLDKLLYVHLNNGQSFHLHSFKCNETTLTRLGYTNFNVQPITLDISKLSVVETSDNNKRAEQQQVIDIESTDGSKMRVRLDTSAFSDTNNWARVSQEFAGEGKHNWPGWAWQASASTFVDTREELERMHACSEAYKSDVLAGRVCDMSARKNLSTATHKPLVVSLRDLACADALLVGAKAASLAHLTSLASKASPNDDDDSFEVAHAFVLTRYAYECILEHNQEANKHLESELEHLRQLLVSSQSTGDDDKLAGVRDKCAEIERYFCEQMVLPSALDEQLRTNLLSLVAARQPQQQQMQCLLAVRSSSWGEDEHDMSAAGQLKTLLNIDEHSLGGAILACYASKFSYENITYKRQHGLPLDLPMAVVVQAMVACDKAGVLFTCDPTTGDERTLVITANYGLGESVVSAQADPDHIEVSINSNSDGATQLSIKQVSIGDKKTVISADDSVDRDRLDRTKCCMSESEILHLARVSVRVRQYFACTRAHCDIEWGFIGEHKLYLFQCRPVTNLTPFDDDELEHEFDRPPQSEVFFYTRANVGEVMPHACKPLPLTYVSMSFIIELQQMIIDYLGRDHHTKPIPHCTYDFPVERYFMFFNLCCNQLIALDQANKSVMMRAFEIGLFGRELEPQPELMRLSSSFAPIPNPYESWRGRLESWRLRLQPRAHLKRLVALMDKKHADALEMASSSSSHKISIETLFARMQAITGELYDVWRQHIWFSMLDSQNHLRISEILAKYCDNDPHKLSMGANKLLSLGSRPLVISAEIPRQIQSLAQLIRTTGAADEFMHMNFEQAYEYLTRERTQVGDAFRDFMRTFGHRCYGEFDISRKTWREQPEQLIQLIKQNLSSAPPPSSQSQATPSSSSFDQLLNSLELSSALSRTDKWRLKHLIVPECQLFLAARELTKSNLIKFFDCERLLSRALARKLVEMLRLPDEDLLYYVAYDELQALVARHEPCIVMRAARRRQLFRRRFERPDVWKFDEIISGKLEACHERQEESTGADMATHQHLSGVSASSGRVRGRVRLIENYDELSVKQFNSPNDELSCILVTHSTDIAFSPVFPLLGGVITEVGGLISHGAVVAREYGLPCVIGVKNATKLLHDDELIELDADRGIIMRLSHNANSNNIVSSSEKVEPCERANDN